MGNKSSSKQSLETSFTQEEVAILQNHYTNMKNSESPEEYIKSLSKSLNYEDLPEAIFTYFEYEDFPGFVRGVEICVFGKHYSISTSYNAVTLLSNILNSQNSREIVSVLLHCMKLPLNNLDYILPTSLSISDLASHLSRHFPMIMTGLSSYTKSLFLNIPPYTLPLIPSSESLLSPYLSILCLSHYNISQQPSLHLLYQSAKDGLSFNRLMNALMGYDGAVFLLMKTWNEDILGVYLADKLKETRDFEGSPESFIFTLYPRFDSFRTSDGFGASHYYYLNSKIENSKAFPKGLGFGGNLPDAMRLWIDNDIENKSYVSSYCETYRPGNIAQSDEPQTRINIYMLEAWGCGGQKALESLESYRNLEAQRITNSRKVNKAQLISSDFDKEFLMPNTFRAAREREER
jgi:hypothetical protein